MYKDGKGLPAQFENTKFYPEINLIYQKLDTQSKMFLKKFERRIREGN